MLYFLKELNIYSMIFRIILAISIGGIIGLERELKGRSAGFRTYMLVALGSALTMILGQYFSTMLDSEWYQYIEKNNINTDVARIGAQVINGVGFLGAGTILVTGNQEVKGLTTAAGLWTAACIGIAIGIGFYECVIVSFILLMVVMSILPHVENAVLKKSRYMNISVDLDSMEKLTGIISYLRNLEITVYDVEIDKNISSSDIKQTRVYLTLKLSKKMIHTILLAKLSSVNGVLSIDEI